MTTLRRIAAVASGSDTTSKTLSGYELDPAPSVGALSLPEASNGDADFTFKAADGRLLIVYFGYTSCPDVCPTTLAEVKKAFKQLGDAADKVDVAMATIDPNRDTGEIITGYVQSFIPGAHALRSEDPAQLASVAAMYVVNDQGDVVLTWPFGIPADGIATDLEILFDRSAK